MNQFSFLFFCKRPYYRSSIEVNYFSCHNNTSAFIVSTCICNRFCYTCSVIHVLLYMFCYTCKTFTMDYLYFLTFLLWIAVLNCQYGSSTALKGNDAILTESKVKRLIGRWIRDVSPKTPLQDMSLPVLKPSSLSKEGLKVKGTLVPLLPANIARYEVELVPVYIKLGHKDYPRVVIRGDAQDLDFVLTAPQAGLYSLNVDVKLEQGVSCASTVCVNEYGGCKQLCFQGLSHELQVSALNCESVTSPQYGSVKKTNHDKVGSTATFSCGTGWRLAENAVTNTTCLASGKWSNKTPDCQIVTCGPPPSVIDGNRSSTSVTYNSIAEYSCNEHFRLQGSSTRRCGEDGMWSDDVPVCKAVTCGSVASPQNGSVQYTNLDKVGSTATFSCGIGWRLAGNAVTNTTCLASGKWSNEAPDCQKHPAVEPANTSLTTGQTVGTVIGATLGSVIVLGIIAACCFKKHFKKQLKKHFGKPPNNENKSLSSGGYVKVPVKDHSFYVPDYVGESVSCTGVHGEPPSYQPEMGPEQPHQPQPQRRCSTQSSILPDNATDIIAYMNFHCPRDRSGTDETL